MAEWCGGVDGLKSVPTLFFGGKTFQMMEAGLQSNFMQSIHTRKFCIRVHAMDFNATVATALACAYVLVCVRVSRSIFNEY